MIRRLFCILAAIFIALTGSAHAARPELVRLHVIAEDDSPEAQALKLEVRDAVLLAARELLNGCSDANAAYEMLTENLSVLESAAQSASVAPVRAETGVFSFPDRSYCGVLVPAGNYRALRIVIGEGTGRNWWCILFPTLCVETDGHSFILDWLKNTFGGETP